MVKPGDIFQSKYGDNLYLVVEPERLKGWKKGELMAMRLPNPKSTTFDAGAMFRFDEDDVGFVATDVQFVPVDYDPTKECPKGRPFVVSLDGRQEMVICAEPLDITGEEDLLKAYDHALLDLGLFDLRGKHLVCEGVPRREIRWTEYEVYDILVKLDQAA